MNAFIGGMALGALWGIVGFWWRWRRERRRALAEHRARARVMRAEGEDVYPAWMITGADDPLFRDPAEEAAYREWRVRRRYGEFTT